jgi:hypothetical protein
MPALQVHPNIASNEAFSTCTAATTAVLLLSSPLSCFKPRIGPRMAKEEEEEEDNEEEGEPGKPLSLAVNDNNNNDNDDNDNEDDDDDNDDDPLPLIPLSRGQPCRAAATAASLLLLLRFLSPYDDDAAPTCRSPPTLPLVLRLRPTTHPWLPKLQRQLAWPLDATQSCREGNSSIFVMLLLPLLSSPPPSPLPPREGESTYFVWPLSLLLGSPRKHAGHVH